jgi:ubiquinone/menaquinone biosynthesis C-methylase UbiE
MSFFSWAAPFFARFGDRWSPNAIAELADRLRPYLTERRAVLDLGGGTGQLAVHLAESLPAEVTVLDATPEMLAYVPEGRHVTPVVGCAEKMPFADGTFDAVVITDAFHHFGDQDAAVAEIRRVLRPGGALYIDDFSKAAGHGSWAAGEKLLTGATTFFTAEELCAFLGERGFAGTCEKTSGLSYFFLGTVQEKPS